VETNKTNRRAREYLVHRKEILLAAEKVFATKGFFTTKMTDIAYKAEFGTGTLYKYFKSKEDLYFTLIDEKMEEINQLVKAVFSQKTTSIKKIEKVMRLLFEFIERNRDFFSIYISERNRFEWTIKDDLGKAIYKKMVAYIKLLSEVLKQGVKEGEFKSMSPLDLAHALVGIVNSLVFEWLISSKPYSLNSKVDNILEIFLRGAQSTERRS
jgi:AcrR family transcriptional regulator